MISIRDARDEDVRDVEMPWIELGRGQGSDRQEDDPRDRAHDMRHQPYGQTEFVIRDPNGYALVFAKEPS
jgi:hypothetical protein